MGKKPLRLQLTVNKVDNQMVEIWERDECANQLAGTVHIDTFLWCDLYDELQHHGSINVEVKFAGGA